jgi:hypothetical protein
MFIDPDGRDLTGSSGSAGATLTEDDRRRLEAQLRRLAPGTRVDAQGNVHKGGLLHRIWNHLSGHGAGQALVTKLVNSRQNTNVVVTTTRDSGTDGNPANIQGGTATDAVVYWNPNQTAPANSIMVRTSDAPYSANGSVTSEFNPDLAIVLGHELIHASHIVNGTASLDDTATHDFVVRVGNTYETYRESAPGQVPREEFRTVGFSPYAHVGELTETVFVVS